MRITAYESDVAAAKLHNELIEGVRQAKERGCRDGEEVFSELRAKHVEK
ncbi:MAG: hypothetical protein LBT55_03400 [Clostridiaceae bacterium]|jgi:hypothetical protein|nr:hypothetical protein [Clostridiaceae bacterium]